MNKQLLFSAFLLLLIHSPIHCGEVDPISEITNHSTLINSIHLAEILELERKIGEEFHVPFEQFILDFLIMLEKAQQKNSLSPAEKYITFCIKNDVQDIFTGILERSVSWIHLKGNYGETPLHLAVGQIKPAIAELFLKHGADVNAQDTSGFTPLHWAIELWTPNNEKSFALVQLLITNGALINAKSNAQVTPLMIAHSKANFNLCKMLIDNGADRSFLDPITEESNDFSKACKNKRFIEGQFAGNGKTRYSLTMRKNPTWVYPGKKEDTFSLSLFPTERS